MLNSWITTVSINNSFNVKAYELETMSARNAFFLCCPTSVAKVLNINIEKKDCKNRIKYVLNISYIYHKNKSRVHLETHIFISYMTCIIFYCILGLLQHKNAAIIKYQAAARALRISLSFFFPDDCSSLHQPIPAYLVPALVLL